MISVENEYRVDTFLWKGGGAIGFFCNDFLWSEQIFLQKVFFSTGHVKYVKTPELRIHEKWPNSLDEILRNFLT